MEVQRKQRGECRKKQRWAYTPQFMYTHTHRQLQKESAVTKTTVKKGIELRGTSNSNNDVSFYSAVFQPKPGSLHITNTKAQCR